MIRATFYVGSRAWSVVADVVDEDPAPILQRTIGALATLGIDGATLTTAIGVWRGEPELSLVVTLLGDYTEETVRQIAESLRDAHDQDAVLWTMETVHGGTEERARPVAGVRP